MSVQGGIRVGIRVGIIAYAFERPAPPSFASYTLELAQAITRDDSGVEVILLTTARQAARHLPDRFETHTLPGCKWLPGLLTVGNLAVAAAARSLDLDIVHDPTGASPFFLRPRAGGWQAITTIHDLVSFVYPETHTTLTNLMHRVWLPRAVRQASAVITVSRHSKGDIGRYLGVDGDRVVVVPCGVGPEFTPRADAGEWARLAARYSIRRPYILYLGGVGARKNVTGLLHAFARLRRTYPDHTLVVAGATIWKSQPVYDAVERLALAPHVCFTGYVADEDLPALYRQATLFAFPSLYEGFGRPPLEAMACGIPVVTADSSSLPEVTADAALLVDPHDPAGLAEAMGRLLASADLRRMMVEKGLERARHFTWERAGQQIVALYRRILEGETIV